jgi:hypothetical protein
MQRIGTAWELLEKHSMDPQELLGLVSTALESNPQVMIEGLEWAPVQPIATASNEEGTVATEGDPGQVESADPAEAEAPVVEAGTQEQRIRLAIRGRVEPFDGNYPLAFLGVRTFMQSLRSDPRVISVKARKEPLDVSLQSTLTGEITPQMATGKAGFTINVLLRVRNESA